MLQPVGLTNLGATCWLNTLLQTLFHCLPFREAVYRYSPPKHSNGNILPQCILRELQKIFGCMEVGIQRETDCEDLVELIAVERCEQQDPIEGWKFLGSQIEQALKESKDAQVSNLFNQV